MGVILLLRVLQVIYVFLTEDQIFLGLLLILLTQCVMSYAAKWLNWRPFPYSSDFMIASLMIWLTLEIAVLAFSNQIDSMIRKLNQSQEEVLQAAQIEAETPETSNPPTDEEPTTLGEPNLILEQQLGHKSCETHKKPLDNSEQLDIETCANQETQQCDGKNVEEPESREEGEQEEQLQQNPVDNCQCEKQIIKEDLRDQAQPQQKQINIVSECEKQTMEKQGQLQHKQMDTIECEKPIIKQHQPNLEEQLHKKQIQKGTYDQEHLQKKQINIFECKKQNIEEQRFDVHELLRKIQKPLDIGVKQQQEINLKIQSEKGPIEIPKPDLQSIHRGPVPQNLSELGFLSRLHGNIGEERLKIKKRPEKQQEPQQWEFKFKPLEPYDKKGQLELVNPEEPKMLQPQAPHDLKNQSKQTLPKKQVVEEPSNEKPTFQRQQGQEKKKILSVKLQFRPEDIQEEPDAKQKARERRCRKGKKLVHRKRGGDIVQPQVQLTEKQQQDQHQQIMLMEGQLLRLTQLKNEFLLYFENSNPKKKLDELKQMQKCQDQMNEILDGEEKNKTQVKAGQLHQKPGEKSMTIKDKTAEQQKEHQQHSQVEQDDTKDSEGDNNSEEQIADPVPRLRKRKLKKQKGKRRHC